jgi:hypothetical protein
MSPAQKATTVRAVSSQKSQKCCLQPKKLGLLRIVSSLDVSIGDKQLLQTGIVVDLMFC